MSIEKLEPGADTSARVIDKINEIIDAINRAHLSYNHDGGRTWEIIWGGREFTKKGGER